MLKVSARRRNDPCDRSAKRERTVRAKSAVTGGKKACELAGLETLKCEVKELTHDEAIIVMVESNLQRSVILSE